MANYVFFRKSRNKLSSLLHILINVIFGTLTILLTIVTNNILPGIILVLTSKWRIFAVHPRFWLINFRSNLVDIIVGTSIVIITKYTGTSFSIIHIIYIALYILWLLVIKTKTNSTSCLIQSLFAVFLGTTASTLIIANNGLSSMFLMTLEFIIIYSSTRHFISQEKHSNYSITAMFCGLFAAEAAWLANAWTIIYTYDYFVIPQFSIIITVAFFSLMKILNSIEKHEGKVRASETAPPAIFAIITIAIIIFLFSNPIFNI